VSGQAILGTFFLAVLRIRQAAQPVLLDAPHGARALARSAKPDLCKPNKQSQALNRWFLPGQDDLPKRLALPGWWPCI
jgi:hypothetical protein